MRKSNQIERSMGKWPAGADNVTDLRSLEGGRRSSLRSAENVDIDARGKVRRRGGYSLMAAGAAHSMWAPDDGDIAFFVQAGELRTINESGEITAIALTHASRQMRFVEMAGRVFGSNGQTRFVIDQDGIRPWGLDDPIGQPTLTATATGGMKSGRYQVVITHIDVRGQESGTGRAEVVEVPENGGISLAAIPQPGADNVPTVRVYCTQPDGEVLYQVRDLPVGVTATVISVADIRLAGRDLWTQFAERVPPCRLLMAFRGRIYFVPEDGDGTRLYYTLPLSYGLYRPDTGFLPMPGRIADLVPVLEGFYVGTDKQTIYFAGNDPDGEMQRRTLDSHGMVPGTATTIRGAAFGADASQTLTAVWWSTNGELIRGDSGGVLTPLTRGRLAIPSFTEGTILHREQDGISQLINVLKGAKAPAAGFGARDRAVAQVVRNGITI